MCVPGIGIGNCFVCCSPRAYSGVLIRLNLFSLLPSCTRRCPGVCAGWCARLCPRVYVRMRMCMCVCEREYVY